MNKYKEALGNLYFASCNPYRPKKDAKILQENMNTLNELVEKATPKKVKLRKTPYDYIEFECPNCNKVTTTNFIRRYCGECGQALDWSEEE